MDNIYTGNMDKECIELCDAMNIIPGIETIESCCGHDKTPYHIWFTAKNLSVLPRLLYYFDGCHCGYYDWIVLVKTDCGMSPVTFLVERPITGNGWIYEESKHIARLLKKEFSKENGHGNRTSKEAVAYFKSELSPHIRLLRNTI